MPIIFPRFVVLSIVVLVALWPRPAEGQTTQPSWQHLPQGELILRPFANAPYPHPSREHGFKGRATTYPADPHYVDSTVGVFVPAGYATADTVDYVVHFHGHNNHVAKVIPQYQLIEQMAAAKVKAVLLVPQGPKDAADSGGGKLELDDGALSRLLEEVTAYLVAGGKARATAKVGHVVLTSHSGGYKVTAAVLERGGPLAEHITDVLLLDSSYGSLESYARWAGASPSSHRLVSLYTQHLEQANRELMQLLDRAGTKYESLAEAELTDERLAARTTIFAATQVAHDEVPVKYFGRLLKTSALAQ
jgi:hypothetical protein